MAAHHDVINDMLYNLMCDECEVAMIDYGKNTSMEYNDEYILNLDDEGIWIEKAKMNGKYYALIGDVVYVSSDCNCKILEDIESDRVVEFIIGEEESDEESGEAATEENKVDIYNIFESSESGEPHGFTVSKTEDGCYRSFSYYSTSQLSTGRIDELLEKFVDRF